MSRHSVCGKEPKMEKNDLKRQCVAVSGKLTAVQYRKQRMRKGVCMVLRVLLVIGTVLCCLIVNVGCATGWISSARAGSNWPMEYVGYGQMMLVSSGLLVLSAVLVLLSRKNWVNWAAVLSGSVGMTLCMIALYRVADYAADSGFYSKLMDMPVDSLYRLEILPTWIPFVCMVALALLQYFSPEARTTRFRRKYRDTAKTPSILDSIERE